MEFFTIVCSNYEEAVNKARLVYGDSMRIISRKDFSSKGLFGLGSRKKCELSGYLVNTKDQINTKPVTADSIKAGRIEDEASSYSQFFEENDKQKQQLELDKAEGVLEVKHDEREHLVDPFLEKAKGILHMNEFDESFSDKMLTEIKKQLISALPDLPADQDFEILLLDNIVSSFESDHSTQLYPPRFFVLCGPSGVGKTATASKIGNLICSGLGKRVEVVQLSDSQPAVKTTTTDPNGVFHSIHDCHETIEQIIGESNRDIYIIDSFSDEDKRKDLLSFFQRLPKEDTRYFVVMDASMKDKDMVRTFSLFGNIAFQSLVLTKCDESETIGNVLSVCNHYGLPLLFIIDGIDLMSNIHFASSFAILSKLKGFSLDMDMLVQGN